jgi:(p)ppGpp synthase/HD superfamily hydrolase
MTENALDNNPLVLKAIEFANAAHSSIGQLRKYTGEPYIVHPLDVIDILLTYSEQPVTVGMLAAAACHDVVEDTQVSLDTVSLEFGTEVAQLVSDLTDVSRPTDGNRRVRKQIDLEHSAQACAASQTVKLADLISNAPSIVDHDPGFARVWLREKAALLDVLVKGDAGLMRRARAVLAECKLKLENQG